MSVNRNLSRNGWQPSLRANATGVAMGNFRPTSCRVVSQPQGPCSASSMKGTGAP